MTPKQMYRQLAVRAAQLAAEHPDPPSTRVAALIEELALVAAEESPSAEPISALEEGGEYELTLRVRAVVVEVHDGHGLCYMLRLEPRDFFAGRDVSVDHDEIARAKRRG